MRDQGRVVVMAVLRPDGRLNIYMKPSAMMGLKSSMMKGVEVKEMLDCLSWKYNNGTIEAPSKVGTVSICDLEEVHKALDVATMRSNDRIVILP